MLKWTFSMTSKGRFPLRKISIGSDRTGLSSILYYPQHRPKKVENTLKTRYHSGCGSQVQTGTENWY